MGVLTKRCKHGLKIKCQHDKLIFMPVPNLKPRELFKIGQTKIKLNGEDINLMFTHGKAYATQAYCPHAGGPLYKGDIEELPYVGPCVSCPRHHFKFSLTTGQCERPCHYSSHLALKIYPVLINCREIRIGFDSISPAMFNTPPK